MSSIELFGRKLIFGLTTAFLLCLLVSFIAFLSLRSVIQVKDAVLDDQAHDLVELMELRLASEQKIGLNRAYLLTGEESFLLAAEATRSEFFNRITALAPKLQDPTNQAYLVKLRDAETAHNAALGEASALVKKKGVPARKVGQYFDEIVKPAHSRLVSTFDDAIGYQKARLERAKGESSQAARFALRLILFSSGVSLVLGITVLVLVGKTMEKSRDVELAVKRSYEELDRRVQERTAELQASNQELEAFSYSVSHDLRAPLRGIDGFSQALMDDYDDKLDATGKQYLRYIREGIQKMGRLIDDLLELSRLTRREMNREQVDLSELAKQVAEKLSREHGASRSPVDFHVMPEAVVMGDPGLLSAAVENLLSNAWKFTAKNPRPRVEFGVEERDGKPVYYVRDNGAGFDMAYLDKLFGAFQRLHSPKEFHGNGVGLATVRRIIRRHGGNIWAEGKVGEGATFYFTL